MLRINLQFYRITGELLADRTFEQEVVRVGPTPDSDLVLEDLDGEVPSFTIQYRQGAYRILAERGSSIRLNSASVPDGPEGTILSHEDMLSFGRHSIVVRFSQAGWGDHASPLWLLGIAGPLFGVATELRAMTVIGRQTRGANEADVLIPQLEEGDEALSRQHARFTWMPGDVVEYRDISKHAEEIGSWVNRRRAQRGLTLPVRPGDEVMIGPWGRHIFRLVRHEEWDFRPPKRVPAGGAVFAGWVARFVLPIAGAILVLAGAAFAAFVSLPSGAIGVLLGLAGLVGWRIRLMRRRGIVLTRSRKLKGRLRV